MKVMEINSSCETGSTGRNVREIADYLNDHSIECYIAHTSGFHYFQEYLIGNKVANKIHALFSRLTGWQEIYSWYETKKLVAYIVENGFDVVNINNVHSNYVCVPYLINELNKANILIVLTLHDCWFYTGKCTHYTKDKCYLWKQECGNCPRLKKDIKSWFFDCTKGMLNQKRKLYENAKDNLAVIGVSDWITAEAKQSILACAKHIYRIYNWVDLQVFSPSEQNNSRVALNLPINKRILLGVAIGWTDDKGLSDFIKLGEILREGYEIILVGEDIEHRVLPPNVRIVGRTDGVEELANYYNASDCFLSLSEEESFGKVVAEALACGTPVIVYHSTASPELVGEGCGSVVRIHDIEQLRDNVVMVCDKGKSTYSDKCRRFAEKHFDKETNIKEYKNVFELFGGAVGK